MDKMEIKQFVEKWMKGYEPDTFIPNQYGNYVYSSGPSSIDLPSFFEDLLEDYIESLRPLVEQGMTKM